MSEIGPTNLQKFESTVSELRVALLLCKRSKQVMLLPDNYLPGKSPDMLVQDALGESYVEVVRFSNDDVIDTIFGRLTKYLDDSLKPYRIDVSLSADLSTPVVGHVERRASLTKTEVIVGKFNETIESIDIPILPTDVVIDLVKFTISRSPIGKGFVGTIGTPGITLPMGAFSSRIRFLVADPVHGKAAKRKTWTGSHLLKYYMIAIVVEQPFFDEESALEALLGSRVHHTYSRPETPIHPEVEKATNRGWKSYLERVHLLPTQQSIFSSYGIYLTDPICKNVSGTIVLTNSDAVLFVPNPFASEEINDSRLASFV